MRRLAFVSCALLAVVAVAWAADQVFLVKKVAKGDTFSYTLKMDYEIAGTTGSYSAKVTDKVIGVDETGNISIETKSTESKTTLNGIERPSTDSSYTTVFDPRNQILAIVSDRLGSDGARFSRLLAVVFPEKPIKEGETWSITQKADEDKGFVETKSDYILSSREEIDGVKTVKISFVTKETGGEKPAGANGSVWYEEATGMMVKSEVNLVDAPLGEVTFGAKVSQARVKK